MAGFDNDIMFATGSDVGVFPNTTSSDNSTEFSRSGSDVKAIVYNSSNTASSTAHHELRVEGTSAGDVWYQTSIGSTKSYAIGQDQADTFLRITTDAASAIDPSSGTTLLQFDEGVVGAFRAFFPIPNMALGGSAAASGVAVDSNIINSNAAAGSDARLSIQVNNGSGAGGGNSYITYTGPADNWFHGADKSDSTSWKLQTIQVGNFPSANTVMKSSVAGEVTFPLTPAFLATQTVAQTNVIGTGGAFATFTTEVFDQNADYDTTTSTFTAPVTGRYLLSFRVMYSSVSTSTAVIWVLVTSNRNYNMRQSNGRNEYSLTGGEFLSAGGSILADMDAGDTAQVQILAFGLAGNTIDTTGNASECFFGGNLQC